MELKDSELKNKKYKLKERDRTAIFNPSLVSLADVDNLKEKETNKLRLIEYTWYDWTINYFLEPITKITDNYNDKIASFLNINTPK